MQGGESHIHCCFGRSRLGQWDSSSYSFLPPFFCHRLRLVSHHCNLESKSHFRYRPDPNEQLLKIQDFYSAGQDIFPTVQIRDNSGFLGRVVGGNIYATHHAQQMYVAKEPGPGREVSGHPYNRLLNVYPGQPQADLGEGGYAEGVRAKFPL